MHGAEVLRLWPVDGHSGCGLGALSFAAQTNGGEDGTVPAGGPLDLTPAGALSMAMAAAAGG